jgi:hypothetical protein
MPRTARAAVEDICYRVLNRGKGRMRVFHKEAHYLAFLKRVDGAPQRLPRRVLSCRLTLDRLGIESSLCPWRRPRKRPEKPKGRVEKLECPVSCPYQ